MVSIQDKIKLICVILYSGLGTPLISKEQRKMVYQHIIFKMINIMSSIK